MATTESNPGPERGLRKAPVPAVSATRWVYQAMSPAHEAAFVALACMSQFCTRTLILLSKVGDDFHLAEEPQLNWLIAGYSLTVGTFILFSGRLGDVVGHKPVLTVGLAWFSLWSLISGLSVYSSFNLAVVSRVLQGIGPALCLPNAVAILGRSYPPGRRKAMVFAFFGGAAPMGAVVGGAFAAVLSLAWWPWAQWALSMWLAILCFASAWIVPEVPRSMPPSRAQLSWIQTLDLPASIIGIAALILFNFAWIQAPVCGWNSATAIVPLVLGILLFATFIYVEIQCSPSPLIPWNALNTDVAFVLGAVACGWAAFGIWSLYLVKILEEIRHLSPLLTMAWLSPLMPAGAVAAVVTGYLLGAWHVRPAVVMTLSLLAFTVGVILTTFTPLYQIYWGQTFVSMLVMSFGMDMSFPAATLILSNKVSAEHQGIAASLVNTVVNYGIALGVGFAGTVEVQLRGSGRSAEDQLTGFHGALYMATGVAGLGLGICLVFLARH
ncbi:hypothetical protein PWT90_01508 [Aphanocladium album]|nr:hypothetical protein PWT90_01508 [Aphanocladium album]